MALFFLDYVLLLVMSIVMIVGGYQFYFWCQRQTRRKRRRLLTRFDEMIPYRPGWVWIYSVLYYPVIVLTIFTMSDTRQFIYIVASYLALLAFQMVFFLYFPVEAPREWRARPRGDSLSGRLLRQVWKYDSSDNCFPSMHVSVAVLTALHIGANAPALSPWIFAFPILIALSALYTKQHYLADLPAGAILGWLVFEGYRLLLLPGL